VSVTGRINNVGPAPSGPFKVRFHASIDATITAADIVIGELHVTTLAGNSALTFTGVLPLPASVPAGRYVIGWLIDADGSVNESNETNNAVAITAQRLEVVTPGSELRIAGIDRHAGGIDIQFTSKPGYVYAIERSDDLAQWTRLFVAIPGTGGVLTRTDTAGASAARAFYRAVEE
jgi:hypothetical protein